jgi:hypothetical protein
MRTETPRIRQLTFQLEHAPCVLTRRTLAAAATAPSHPLPAGRSRNDFILVGGVTAEKADKENSSPVYLSSQQKERRFLPGPRSGVSAPEM